MTTTTPRQGCQPAPYPPADAGHHYWDACEPPCWWAARGTLVQQEPTRTERSTRPGTRRDGNASSRRETGTTVGSAHRPHPDTGLAVV